MGAPKNTTTTTTADPPDYLKPYLTQAADASTNLYQQGPKQYFPFNTLANQSGATLDTLSNTYNRATQGSPAVQAGQNFITNGLNGQANPAYSANNNFFGSASNPYLDATFNKAALATQNQLDSQYARAGRNVGAGEPIRAQQLNDLATNIYGGAYETERNRMAQEQGQNQALNANSAEQAAQRQQGLLGYGIPYANQDYTDLQQAASVGQAQDQRTQAETNAAMDKWNFNQNAAGVNLDDYIRRLTGFAGTGGTQTATGPSGSNPFGSALGGGLSGASLGMMLGGPMGAGIGALGGGLLGGIFG